MSSDPAAATVEETIDDLDREVAVFGQASELTLGIAGPNAEAGVPQTSHV